jgi:hypothetical protein
MPGSTGTTAPTKPAAINEAAMMDNKTCICEA